MKPPHDRTIINRGRHNDPAPKSRSPHESPAATRPRRSRTVAIGYARVAAYSQATPRAELDVQEATIRARASSEGLDLAGIITDAGESAHNLKRPGLTQLLRMLDFGNIGVVITTNISRLARNTQMLHELLHGFTRRRVALIITEEELDTRTSEGRRELQTLDRDLEL